jgi:predicted RNA-binding Zn-ribbon protein involved in translation (DUF1610 family)
MELTYACRSCGAIDRVPSVEHASALICPACGDTRPVAATAIDAGNLVGCAVCGTEDLYFQKDFPQGLGLAIVFVGFAISSVFWYYDRPLWTYAILLSSALLDMVLYYRVPNVSICYRCLAQYRGDGANPGGRFKFFDLAIGERYRQERLRVEEHRERERAEANRGDLPQA